ncbi:uncharacterized protein [Magallana gigas]|uniref:uncharacterized protein n=1 Tax=Magallana gigas TaxID=29159 RepID=UPI003340F04A
METSGSVPRENKFEERQEQPNDNHPTRNRELTERNDKSSSSRKQHFEKRKHVEDSSDSENEQLVLRPNSILLSSNNKKLIMETSGSIPREHKFEEGKEQPNDNHPTRNRELTERSDKSSSSRKQHFEKRKHVEDSSDSENEQFKRSCFNLNFGQESDPDKERNYWPFKFQSDSDVSCYLNSIEEKAPTKSCFYLNVFHPDKIPKTQPFKFQSASDVSCYLNGIEEKAPVVKPVYPPAPPPPVALV